MLYRDRKYEDRAPAGCMLLRATLGLADDFTRPIILYKRYIADKWKAT